MVWGFLPGGGVHYFFGHASSTTATEETFTIFLSILSFSEIEQINDREKRSSPFLHLSLEFPRIHYGTDDYTVVYFEKNGDDKREFKIYADLVRDKVGSEAR